MENVKKNNNLNNLFIINFIYLFFIFLFILIYDELPIKY